MKLQTQAATGSKTAQKQLQQALKSTPPVVVQFAKSINDAKDAYKTWGDSLAKPVLRPLTAGLNIVQPALKAITPLVRVSASAIGILVKQLAAKIQGGGLERVVTVLLPYVRPVILNLAHTVGNLAAGIWGIVKAFLPMSVTITGGVEKLTAKFKDWANSLPSHTGFQSLMATFRSSTPLAVQALKNLVIILSNVAKTMTGIANPANSKMLLQILIPITAIMAKLSANEQLVRTVLYFALLRSILLRLSPAFTALGTGLKILTGKELESGLGRLVGGFRDVDVAASKASGAAGTFGGKLKLMLLAGGGVPAAIAATAVAITGLIIVLNRVKSGTQDWIDSLRKQDQATGYNIAGYKRFKDQLASTTKSYQQLTYQQAQQNVGIVAASKLWQAHEDRLRAISAASAQAGTAYRNLTGNLRQLASEYGLTSDQAIKLATGAGVTAGKLQAGGDTARKAMVKVQNWAGATNLATGQTNLWTIKLGGLSDSLDKLNNKLTGSATNELNWRDALKQANDTLNQNNGTLAINTQKGRDDRRAIIDATSAALSFANTQLTTGHNVKGASQTIKDQIDWLKIHGGKTAWVRDLIAQLNGKLRDMRTELRLLAQQKHINELITISGTGNWKATAEIPGEKGMHFVGRFSTGGRVPGFGGGDKFPYLLEGGEAVVDKQRARRYAPVLSAMGVPGMASGGVAGGTLGSWTASHVNASQQKAATAVTKAIVSAFSGGSGKLAQMLALERSYVGKVPYVWGGQTPGGWDCSGMQNWIMHQFGFNPPRIASDQQLWARPSGNRPGALVFFGAPAYHVGMSMGGGQMVSALGTKWGTTISSLAGNSGFGVPPGTAGGYGGQGMANYSPVIANWLEQAIRDTGRPNWWLRPLEWIQQHESNVPDPAHAYNPNGGASGLMQMKPATYRQYATIRGGIWNPVSNAAAAIRYIMARYGIPQDVPGYGTSAYVGYAGGAWRVPQTGPALVHRDEMILPPAVASEVRSASSGGGEVADLLSAVLGELQDLNATAARAPGRTASGMNQALSGTARRAAYAAQYGA